MATENLSLLCALDILFLRPDTPGKVLSSGDIDNRLKTIFDALRMPSGLDELGGYERPGTDEQPFFCLLEDDKQISKVAVETDMLLEPIGETLNINDARLVITVKLKPYLFHIDNARFG